MSTFLRMLLATIALLAGMCAANAPQRSDASQRILVTLRYDATDAMHGDPVERYRRPHDYAAGPNIDSTLDALAAQYGIARVAGWPMRSLALHCEVYALAPGADITSVVAQLAQDTRIDSAEPLQRFRTLASASNDYRSLQHALDELQIDAAHEQSRGRGVRIAVIDSGVDATHPDLIGAVREQRDFASGAPAAHGTEVAGVIAARGNHRMIGVAPDAELLDLRACWGDHRSADPANCDSFSLAQALDYAVTHAADVINLSLVGPDDALLDRLLAAADSRAIAVVAAAPPNADREFAFPTVVPTVIAVGSSDDHAHRSDLALIRAPGVDVLTTFPGARYDYASGSSLAAAHVSGVVALALAVHKQLSPAQVRRLLTAHQRLSADTLLTEAASLSKAKSLR